jgi:serine phosphatase RsbU (regulator of sigma subunit)
MLLGWFLDNKRPIEASELEARVLPELIEPLALLFRAHDAAAMMPLTHRDELIGLLTISELPGGRTLKTSELVFLGRVRDHAQSALVYAHMHREARTRVEMAKELELAVAVQSSLIPGNEQLELGRVTISGIYIPASRCSGDWWTVNELPDGRVLVLIGDVTGHGIASAMITAAARGCYDALISSVGNDIDLVQLLELLDATVRRTGANHFYMTCFASLVDPERGTIQYANAGHVPPYLCRMSDEDKVNLDVLVARGNPLGAGPKPTIRSGERELRAGDTLVWYTDGIVECVNPRRQQFSERRMQRVLRASARPTAPSQMIRDHIARAAFTFSEGQPIADDITLVVAQLT